MNLQRIDGRDVICCSRQDSCANYGVDCHQCWGMSDIQNHYPFYSNKNKDSVKVKFLVSQYEWELENMVNEFASDKNVLDIQYQAVPTANPPYVTNRVLIIYKERCK